MERVSDAKYVLELLTSYFLGESADDSIHLLMRTVIPASMVGDDLEPVGNDTPCLFGGLLPVSPGKLFFSLGYQTFTMYSVALYRICTWWSWQGSFTGSELH